MIDTRDKLIAYIKRQLGAPLINIEVTDDMINDNIDYSIQKYNTFAYDGYERDSFGFDTVPGVMEYKLDDKVQDIITIKGASYAGTTMIQLPNDEMVVYNNMFSVFTSPNTTGVSSFVVNLANQSLIDTIFDKDVNYTFNPSSKRLKFFEQPLPRYLIYCSIDYIPEEVDRIYNNEWIKKMSTAKTKMSWGTVTGKFDQSLVSGARINYADMKSEATEEIQTLDEELMNRYLEPGSLYVG